MKPLFIETICIINGNFQNLFLHQKRLNSTIEYFFCKKPEIKLNEIIIPQYYKKGKVKCRIIYDTAILQIDFAQYETRKIQSLGLIQANINYSYKYFYRKDINTLLQNKKNFDEILVIQEDGQITDTSFTNVVFENSEGLYTPSSYLLNGIRRQQLLSENIIKEKKITVNDMPSCCNIHLINAMLNIGDLYFSVKNIRNIYI